jgi:hypothetical protein
VRLRAGLRWPIGEALTELITGKYSASGNLP